MKAVKQRIENEFVSIEFKEDVQRHCLRVLAKTNPVRQIRQIYYRDVASELCYWTQFKWARLVRWMTTKKWLRKLIPHSLNCFANAREVVLIPHVWEIPEEVDDSIKAQLGGWDKEIPPFMILVGVAACHEMMKSQHFSLQPVWSSGLNGNKFEMYGLSVRLTDKIEKNAVIVL